MDPEQPNFHEVFDAAPVPLLLVLPNAPVFTLVAASDSFLRVSGSLREEIVGRGIFEVFPDNPDNPAASGVRNLGNSFGRVIETGEPDRLPLQRYDVERSAEEGGGFGERYWSALHTPIKDQTGRLKYILQSVEEVTEKVLAERRAREASQQLQNSEKRFRQLAENSAFGLVIADLEGRLSYINPGLLNILGYTEEDVAAGILRWDLLTPEEFAAPDADALRQVVNTGKCMPYEKAYLARDGRRIPILVGASLLEPVNGLREIAAFVMDLTERRQSERDAFLVRVDDATRPLADPVAIMETTARLLSEHLGFDRCAYCVFEDDGETFRVASDYRRPGIPTLVGRYTLSQFSPDAARLLGANLAYVVEDTETDPRTVVAREYYRQIGIRAVIGAPLHKEGRLVAAVSVDQRMPRKWRPDEVDLVQMVANRCWESIERAHLTTALQASERRLRLAQSVGRIGTFDWFMKENKILWTPELEALYGLPEGSFEGGLNDWSKRVLPVDAVRVIEEIENAVARRDAEHTYEFRALLPGGSMRWLRGHAQFIYDENGIPNRMVGVNIDIEGQKQAEIALLHQWHTFDTALSNSPDFVYTFDLNGRFTYINRALLALWQKTYEEAVGKNFTELDYPSELALRLQRQIRQVIDTRKPIRDTTAYTAAGGTSRHYEYIFVPVLTAGGEVEAVVGSTRDITESRLAEEQLRGSARLESLGIMAGGIAHDFNNLLTGILGNASLLAESANTTESLLAGEITLAAERAADLTRQMLAFSGKGRFLVEIFDLNALVRENLTLLRASLSRTVTVAMELDPVSCFINADRTQIQQVVMNLLINGSEATGDQPGTVVIRTSLTERREERFSACLQAPVPAGQYVLLEVVDRGTGMTPETLKKIFDPFFTTKFTGRGLGLAAVLGIVKGHQGDIEVQTEPGEGTTFRVLLPRVQPAKPAAAQKNRQEPSRSVGETVLVADDEEVVRKMARLALESRGFRVVLAADGAEALEVLRSDQTISLVILDLTMPVMSGEQALPLIRKLYPQVPVLLSTGFSEAEISHRFASSGISGVLQKPYTASAIFSKVAGAIKSL